ncbi:D-alanyl-D-alanine carboxypeptidase/D-alanyl-D-alanine-endopeptidase [Planctomycetota bacterium]|nr:D-alanyl-D-alanine carboxypeptidase/D-alanyl-D-alanine-endopeptidase [Planctomycetota bacterium]
MPDIKRLSKFTTPLLFTLITLCICTATLAADIEGQLRNLIQTSNLRKTQYSITVKDLDYDVMLAQINSDTLLIPASNMKLLTTAAAIDLLGTDFAFATELRLVEALDDNGRPSLIIKGDGDPAFCDPILLKQHNLAIEDILDLWINTIKETGITHFGTLYLDDRVFDYQFTHPDWDKRDLMYHYGAEIAGLNFYRNLIDVTPVPSKYLGSEPRIIMFPNAGFLTTINRARTSKQDNFWISRGPDNNNLVFHGNVKFNRRGSTSITVHDPAAFFAQYFTEELGKHGITFDVIDRPKEHDTLPESTSLHAVRTTLPLVLARTNQNSVNMYAESLFKRIANKITGSPGSWANGAAAMRTFLRNLVGTSASTAQIADGSGLSRSNLISSHMLVQLLEAMYDNPDSIDMYRESMAYAGRTADGQRMGEGTLTRRFRDLKSGHWVFGKTGRLTGVKTVSGYYMYPSPEDPTITRTIAFSFMFNNIKAPVQEGQITVLQDKMISQIQKTMLTNDMAKVSQ